MRPLVLALLLPACAPTPQIDVTRFEGGLPPPVEATPGLLPVEREPVRPAPVAGPDPDRVDALRRRAGALGGPVVEPERRARMAGGVR